MKCVMNYLDRWSHEYCLNMELSKKAEADIAMYLRVKLSSSQAARVDNASVGSPA